MNLPKNYNYKYFKIKENRSVNYTTRAYVQEGNISDNNVIIKFTKKIIEQVLARELN